MKGVKYLLKSFFSRGKKKMLTSDDFVTSMHVQHEANTQDGIVTYTHGNRLHVKKHVHILC
jgi:hypothetical protein